MAQNFNSSIINCLVWNTERPFTDEPRRSPSFTFSDNVWYFTFTLNRNKGAAVGFYYLKIFHEEKKTIEKDVDFVVFVRNSTSCITSIRIKSIKDGITIFYFGDNYHIASEYGQWNIYCVFLSDTKIEFHGTQRKTMYLSNMPDSSLNREQNPSQSSTFMRAKLAACAPYDDPSGLESLSCDLNKLLEQKSSANVTLKCGDKTFSAHRTILSARSAVFAAMFENQMVENKTGIVDITDIDGDVFGMLLKYLYSGKVPDIDASNASSLYAAADKYAIQILKTECSKWMLANLTTDNCLRFLFLADSCSDNRFKDRLVTFIAEILELLDEQLWLKFTEEYPKLAMAVFQMRVFPDRNKLSKV